jgi:hypothetical protein
MRKLFTLLAVAAVVGSGLLVPMSVEAQDGPGTRVIAVTTFDAPFGPQRANVMRFMRERWLPQMQLNPNVINLRVSQHYYGSNADQLIVIAEYADLAAIEAPCGAPCQEYFEANPLPEEGTPEREEWDEVVQSWNRWYSRHSDEIFTTWMIVAKTEGELIGNVPSADDEEGEDEGDGN